MRICEKEFIDLSITIAKPGQESMRVLPGSRLFRIPQELGVGRLVYESPRKGILWGYGEFQLETEVEFEITPRLDTSTQQSGIQLAFPLSGNVELSWQKGRNILSYIPGQVGIWINTGEYKRKIIHHADEFIKYFALQVSSEVIMKYLGKTAVSVVDNLQVKGATKNPSDLNILDVCPETELAIQQLYSNPYSGAFRRCFLESKIMEILVRCLKSDNDHNMLKTSTSALNDNDVEKIYDARNYLIEHMEEPPSLKKLANVVGTNEQKLNAGFRQVFGTTVFRYLRQYRMEEARQLLSNGARNVSEVALTVGYSHFGHFAANFRRQFGVTPNKYLSISHLNSHATDISRDKVSSQKAKAGYGHVKIN